MEEGKGAVLNNFKARLLVESSCLREDSPGNAII